MEWNVATSKVLDHVSGSNQRRNFNDVGGGRICVHCVGGTQAWAPRWESVCVSDEIEKDVYVGSCRESFSVDVRFKRRRGVNYEGTD